MEHPWENEPDQLEFLSKHGYHCEILRHGHLGHLCGYIDIEESHPLFGAYYCCRSEMLGIYPDAYFSVHGGITHSGETRDGLWRIGFDCAHVGDLSPKDVINPMLPIPGSYTYKDIEFVKKELDSLSEQLYIFEFPKVLKIADKLRAISEEMKHEQDKLGRLLDSIADGKEKYEIEMERNKEVHRYVELPEE